MEVEYSAGGALIFSYLILMHQLHNFGGLRDDFRSEFIGYRFDGPPIAARLYLTISTKRKRRKPPQSATDGALWRLLVALFAIFKRNWIYKSQVVRHKDEL